MKPTSPIALLAVSSLAAAADRSVEGNVNSSVRVVIYEDLQCPDCHTLRVMMDERLLPRYKDKVAFEHRDFPLGRHAWARPAAIAARHFDSITPELGVEFRRYALANLRQINAGNFPVRLAEFARSKGQDAAKASAALSDPSLGAAVEKDFQEGIARGVSRTPTVFVNGQPFIETFTFEQISGAIEATLKGNQ
jgi:protein-disulfide isomerase